MWVQKWIARRDKLDALATLISELAFEGSQLYHNMMQLSIPKFQWLLDLVSPLIKNQDTLCLGKQ